MKLAQYIDEIVLFLQNYLREARAETYVIGVSGGVDSSLCAVLAKKAVGKENLLAVIIPIESSPEDAFDAQKLCQKFDINYIIYDGLKVFNEFKKEALNAGILLDVETLGNLKARMRMSILYAIAQNKHGLVIGTDNADERYTGYFTKYGDGACDILPIAHLVKNEVIKAAKMLGISPELAERVPSAGLFKGQTDEKEMGVLYRDLDAYLLGEEINEEAKNRIEYLHKISCHKFNEIPTPKPFNRGE